VCVCGSRKSVYYKFPSLGFHNRLPTNSSAQADLIEKNLQIFFITVYYSPAKRTEAKERCLYNQRGFKSINPFGNIALMEFNSMIWGGQ